MYTYSKKGVDVPDSWVPKYWKECPQCTTHSGHESWCGWYFENGEPVGKDAVFHTIHLKQDDPVFKMIAGSFEESLPHRAAKVVNVWSVHNPAANLRYAAERQAMILEGKPVNEVHGLFHTFTSGEKSAPVEDILATGLDIRFAKQGLLGAGIYLTPSAMKASAYWKLPYNRRTMFVCSMLTGRMLVLEQGEHLRNIRKEPWGFDSVCGNFTGDNEYVTFVNNRVRIDFVIDYEVFPGYMDVCQAGIVVTRDNKPATIGPSPVQLKTMNNFDARDRWSTLTNDEVSNILDDLGDHLIEASVKRAAEGGPENLSKRQG